MAIRLAFLLVICAVVAGCGRAEAERTAGIGYDLPYGHVHEFRLQDGTRCVAFVYRGGITCDWQQRK